MNYEYVHQIWSLYLQNWRQEWQVKMTDLKREIGSQIRIVIRISMKLRMMIDLYGTLMCNFWKPVAAIIGRDINQNVEKRKKGFWIRQAKCALVHYSWTGQDTTKAATYV